jgi:hypothetical protein
MRFERVLDYLTSIRLQLIKNSTSYIPLKLTLQLPTSLPYPLLVILVTITFVSLSSSCNLDGMCKNYIQNISVNPDGKSKVVEFTRGCGMTTGTSQEVSMLTLNDSLTNRAGNLFSSDNTAPIAVTWLSNYSVLIAYQDDQEVFQRADRFEDVNVFYKQTKRKDLFDSTKRIHAKLKGLKKVEIVRAEWSHLGHLTSIQNAGQIYISGKSQMKTIVDAFNKLKPIRNAGDSPGNWMLIELQYADTSRQFILHQSPANLAYLSDGEYSYPASDLSRIMVEVFKKSENKH